MYTHSVLNECVAESQSRGGGSHGSYMSPPGMHRAARLASSSLLDSRNVREQAHSETIEQNTLNKGQPASGATFLLLEFLLALLVALLLELLALRKNGAIRSVGFRQRRTTHTGHLVDAHTVSARENAVARSPSVLGP